MAPKANTTVSDTSLMLSVRDGDLGQLSVLFDRYERRLYGFFVRMTANPALSDDLVQEVFLRVLKYRRTFRPESRFSAWLYQIARNARIDHARSHRNESTLDEHDESHLVSSGLTVAPVDAARRQEAEFLRRALAQLPEEKREVLILTRFQGLKHQEIGEILGCNPRTVKVRAFRAIQDLRRIYLRMTGERALWSASR